MQNHESQARELLYQKFIEFVRVQIKKERSAVNKRMFGVVLWCFLLPVLVSVILLILINLGAVPKEYKGSLDWLILIFPVFYALYFLGSEVLTEIPQVFREGGASSALKKPVEEGKWRVKTCKEMLQTIRASHSEWDWLASSYRMDLKAIQYRARYLTGLAGAVFFLIFEGLDSLSQDGWVVYNFGSMTIPIFLERIADQLNQVVGMIIFLVMLYLSGIQFHHTLERYLNCVELISLELKERDEE